MTNPPRQPMPRRPPGVKRTSWTRAARRKDAGRQRSNWRSKNRMVSVPRDKLAFPQSMRATLRYVERVEFLPNNSTTSQVYAFRGNSPQDPYAAFGGHSARGYDQYMGVYNAYTVLSSSCKGEFQYEYYDGPASAASGVYNNMVKTIGTSETVQQPALSSVQCGIRKSSAALVISGTAQQMEKDKTVTRGLNPAMGPVKLSSKGTTAEFFGKEALVGAPDYQGNFNSAPVEEWQWHVWCGRTSDNYEADVVRIVAFITLEYDVVFTEPKQLGESGTLKVDAPLDPPL